MSDTKAQVKQQQQQQQQQDDWKKTDETGVTENLSTGQHDVRRVTSGDDRKTVVIRRTIKGDMSWWTMDKTDLFKRELEVDALLAGSDVIRPKILSYDEDKQEFYLECCEGQTSGSMGSAAPFRCIGAALREVHDTPFDVSKLSHIPQLAVPGPHVLLHGDFHGDNVMIDTSRGWPVSGIIDWEEAAVGHPSIDLANYIKSLKHFVPNDKEREDAVGEFLIGYRGTDPFGDSFPHDIEHDQEAWEYFLEVRTRNVSNWIKTEMASREINTLADMWIRKDEAPATTTGGEGPSTHGQWSATSQK
jgi:aminoglycoside phosphotransferase (APT) family kinase protein